MAPKDYKVNLVKRLRLFMAIKFDLSIFKTTQLEIQKR